MTLNELVERLQKLQAEGCGDEPVFAISSLSDVSYSVKAVFFNDNEEGGQLDDCEDPFIHLDLG